MRYESARTKNGNVGVSYNSQVEANAQAEEMEAKGCSNCSNCYNCSRCSRCSDCSNCYNCSDCSNCSNCSDCSRCYDCSRCSRCSDCSNCSNCSGILRWRGSVVDSLIAINGLTWPVATDGKSIQIGCKCHTIESWSSFDDDTISRMDLKALEFWKLFKPTILILAMAEYRKGLNAAKGEIK